MKLKVFFFDYVEGGLPIFRRSQHTTGSQNIYDLIKRQIASKGLWL